MNIENKLELIKSLEASSKDLNKQALATIIEAFTAAKQKADGVRISLMGISTTTEYKTDRLTALNMWIGKDEERVRRTIDICNAYEYLNLALEAIDKELNRALDERINQLKVVTTMR